MAAKPGCSVDLDGTAEGKTGAQGTLVIEDVHASPHYVHVDCPGEAEAIIFVDPQPGEKVNAQSPAAGSGAPGASALAAAENRTEVHQLLSQAVGLRADGHFPDAVRDLRRAVSLNPDNPNLHHELGTTFLMIGNWDSARVEMLETLRHDPNDADAHNALGFAYEKLGEIRPALDQYRIASRLDPSDDSYQRHYLEVLALLPSDQRQKKKKKRFP